MKGPNKALQLFDLLDITKIFKDVGSEMFLVYGTALGAYRDGDFLPGDIDIDLGSFDVKKRDIIAEKMRKKGYKVSDILDDNGMYLKEAQMIHAKHYIHIDIFFYRKDGDKYIAYRDLIGEPFSVIPIVELEKVKLLGREFNMLSSELLELWYGDWKDKNNKIHGRLHV